jgi:hypothetical protein
LVKGMVQPICAVLCCVQGVVRAGMLTLPSKEHFIASIGKFWLFVCWVFGWVGGASLFGASICGGCIAGWALGGGGAAHVSEGRKANHMVGVGVRAGMLRLPSKEHLIASIGELAYSC